MEFLGILCLILITTTLAGVACKRVGIPAVIGCLCMTFQKLVSLC